jgi:hypothetical protein
VIAATGNLGFSLNLPLSTAGVVVGGGVSDTGAAGGTGGSLMKRTGAGAAGAGIKMGGVAGIGRDAPSAAAAGGGGAGGADEVGAVFGFKRIRGAATSSVPAALEIAGEAAATAGGALGS